MCCDGYSFVQLARIARVRGCRSRPVRYRRTQTRTRTRTAAMLSTTHREPLVTARAAGTVQGGGTLQIMTRDVVDAVESVAPSTLPAHVTDLCAKRILMINARYYAKEMFGDDHSEQWAFSHKDDAPCSAHRGFRVDELLASARAMVQTLARETDGGETALASTYRREIRRLEREMGRLRGSGNGFAMDNDATLVRLPVDVAAPKRLLTSGKALVAHKRCDIDVGPHALAAVPDIGKTPTDPHYNPVGRAYDRMIVHVHHAIRSKTPTDAKAIVGALVARAERCRDLYSSTTNVRRFVRAERKRRAELARPSLLCEFLTSDASAVDFGDALMPYLDHGTSLRLMLTCRDMRDVGRAHGRVLRLALASNDPAARAADSPQLVFPRHATVNNEHVVLRSRHVELKPLIHFEFLKASLVAGSAPSLVPVWLPEASGSVGVARACSTDTKGLSWIAVELVRDDSADPARRTVLRNYGGMKLVTLGDTKAAFRPMRVFDPRIGDWRDDQRDTLLLTKEALPNLNVRIEAQPAQSEATPLRIRVVVHIGRHVDNNHETGVVLTSDSEPFRIRTRNNSDRAADAKRKRNEAETTARRDHRGAAAKAVAAEKADRVVAARRPDRRR